jgi:hypothetical protein
MIECALLGMSEPHRDSALAGPPQPRVTESSTLPCRLHRHRPLCRDLCSIPVRNLSTLLQRRPDRRHNAPAWLAVRALRRNWNPYPPRTAPLPTSRAHSARRHSLSQRPVVPVPGHSSRTPNRQLLEPHSHNTNLLAAPQEESDACLSAI